jgi:hypothetical protein
MFGLIKGKSDKALGVVKVESQVLPVYRAFGDNPGPGDGKTIGPISQGYTRLFQDFFHLLPPFCSYYPYGHGCMLSPFLG